MWTTTVASPIGDLSALASDAGLRAVFFPGRDEVPADARAGDAQPVLVRLRQQLEQYFAGTRQVFDLPLDPVGTEFQQMAWRALREIPFGTTRSYGEQAAAIGRPKSARAVGAANGRNPISIIVPCHRVIGADGSLTGFGGGLAAKRTLLEHEARVVARAGAAR